MRIPYGRSNFGELRRMRMFYADKTPYLPALESAEAGRAYLLFLRPRRFGKSLLVTMLEHYYDLARAGEWDELFGGLWIHEHPTPERHRYLILSLDFSQIAADGGLDALKRSFFLNVQNGVRALLLRYEKLVPGLGTLTARLDGHTESEALLTELMTIVRAAGHQLYVLIDEYDHFANRLLSDGAEDMYEAIVKNTGFVRSFYATLKGGTASGAVGRMFITGVLPLVVDDLASGFNIASNVSNDARFNALAGFTHADTDRALDEFLTARPQIASLPDIGVRGRLMEVLEQYYNGYLFSTDASERLFNSDMILYFLKELDAQGRYPDEMLDYNVRTDYRRFQRLGVLSGAAAAPRRALLESIVAEGGIQSQLVRQFGIRSLSLQTQYISLLYYSGMLTLGRQPPDMIPASFGYRLEIPNRVIRELQWEHLAALLEEQADLVFDTRDLDTAVHAMALQGDIGPFLRLFHERVLRAVGLKDLRRFDEKSLKLMLLSFLSLNRIFYPLSEKELAQGYCDLFLGVSPLYAGARFAWLLELKYLPAGARPDQIDAAFEQAAAQVSRYAGDDHLVPLLTRGQGLRAGALLFVGAQKVLFRPWEPASGGGPLGPVLQVPERATGRGPSRTASARSAPAPTARAAGGRRSGKVTKAPAKRPAKSREK